MFEFLFQNSSCIVVPKVLDFYVKNPHRILSLLGLDCSKIYLPFHEKMLSQAEFYFNMSGVTSNIPSISDGHYKNRNTIEIFY